MDKRKRASINRNESREKTLPIFKSKCSLKNKKSEVKRENQRVKVSASKSNECTNKQRVKSTVWSIY